MVQHNALHAKHGCTSTTCTLLAATTKTKFATYEETRAAQCPSAAAVVASEGPESLRLASIAATTAGVEVATSGTLGVVLVMLAESSSE